MATEDNYVRSLSDLADRLGLSRKHLLNLRKDERYISDQPKARPDGRYYLHDWIAWMTEHEIGNHTQTEVPKTQSMMETKRELEVEKLRLQIEKERELYVRKDDIGPAIDAFMSQLWQRLDRILCSTTPPLYQGKNPSECAAINRDELDRIRIDVNTNKRRMYEHFAAGE